MPFKNLRYIIIFFILILISIFFFSDLKNFFTLGYVKENLINIRLLFKENVLLFSLIFSLIYIMSSALSLPFATLLTLLSGYIFGLTLGAFIVSLCSTVGASIAFLTSKFLFYDFIQKKYKKSVEIGSYPFFRLGKIGVAIVSRSNSLLKLKNVKKDLLKLIKLKKIQILKI